MRTATAWPSACTRPARAAGPSSAADPKPSASAAGERTAPRRPVTRPVERVDQRHYAGYPRAKGAPKPLTLRELRRLARLVQAGLLALDLAGIPRQVALTLEEDAEVRVDLDE